jgi:hypothetical protein
MWYNYMHILFGGPSGKMYVYPLVVEKGGSIAHFSLTGQFLNEAGISHVIKELESFIII